MNFILKPTLPKFGVMLVISFFIIFLNSCNEEEVYVDQALLGQQEEIIPEEEEEAGENDFSLTLEDDFFEIYESTSTVIDIHLNDGDIPDDAITSYSDPTNGDLLIENDILQYAPNDGFTGEDSFVYKICDGETGLTCFEATVTLSVIPAVKVDDFDAELKAFPSAYGGGAYATGGRGGHVYHVTNLDDSGPGSLRDALYKPRPAIIVFDVSGTIELTSWLDITGKDLTIAGQTAPVGGITITSRNTSRFRLRGDCENIIIRYIRIRPASESGDDATELFSENYSHNIIVDHCSVSYGGDESISVRGMNTHNITFSRLLIAEGKTGSLFGDSGRPTNSYDNSYLNSLFFNISHRTPNVASDGRVDIINNVTHQWNNRMTWAMGDIKLNHVNNYYSCGLRGGYLITRYGARQVNIAMDGYDQDIYSAGNIVDKGVFTDPNADNYTLWASNLNGYRDLQDRHHFTDSQHELVGAPMPIKSAVDAYKDVITDVGAIHSLNADGTVSDSRDTQDEFYLNVMAQGEGAGHPYQMYDRVRSWFGDLMYKNFKSSITSTPKNERPSDYDTDRDGMPDVWEKANFGDLSKTSNGDEDGDGYTNIEEFLNQVDKQK